MRLSVLLIAASWAIVASPALCTAGVLAHACPCDDGNAEACDHEADCDVDPCSEQILRKDEAQDRLGSEAGHDVPASGQASRVTAGISERSDRIRIASHHPAPPLGVRHASDLPLLN